MDWSWQIFFVSLPIAIAVSMFGPFAMSAKRVNIYEKKTGNIFNLILAGMGSVGGGVILAAIITVAVRYFDVNYILITGSGLYPGIFC